MVFSPKTVSQWHSAWLMGQASYDKPIQHTQLHEYVHVLWLFDEGGAKTLLRRKLAMHKPPEHIAPALPMFPRLSRKVTWIVLEVCICFCHSVTEPRGCQRYGHSMDTRSATWRQGTTVPPGQKSSWEQDVKIIQNTRGATTRQVSAEKDLGIITDHKINMNHWCCPLQRLPKPECHSGI